MLAALLGGPVGAAASQGDVYMAGPVLEVAQPVDGDLLAAGGHILVARPVAEDAALAAGEVTVRAPIGQDLRAAAGKLLVQARVGGDVRLAGGHVELERGAAIAGSAWIAGGHVRLSGRLGDGARVYAGKLVVDGEVDGDLEVAADAIELRPEARLLGGLRYVGRDEVRIAEGARVAGPIRRDLPPTPEPRRPAGSTLALGLAGLVAAGLLWALLFPSWARSAQAELRRAPARSIVVGAAALLAVPMAAVLLAVTLVGLPLALLLLAAYGFLLLAGWCVCASVVAERLLASTGPTAGGAWRLAALAAALLLLGLAVLLPVLGPIVAALALLAGSGALIGQRLVERRQAYAPREPRPA